ncbi:Transglutaminase-like enzyme, putative cysteine protease [Chitinophaga terrae (ex Kim and Jung 2007)]|uniref:Transglutaminase-like enzyme, putative cysteine protease n=2 Tax=Chitinophaga terrae (ex Kim and Jung 2007) TaxID=408074 RepID=A0A1H4EDF8_9BACT|nr:Transglutaminase-like enzyme, putative cysteine protease [Chitinophaga terrae (ex Kim and Jung 2007)]
MLLAFISFPVSAQKVNIGPAPNWLVEYKPDLSKKPNIKNISDGYYLLLLEEQRDEEKHATYYHYIRQIVSETGIQNGSEISVDYDPQYEKLVFHSILIHRDGQVINRLASSSFKQLQKEQDLSRFIYSGIYTAYSILEDIRKGDQIEYSYSIIGDNPIFNGKTDHRIYFVAYEPILNYYKNLIIPAGRNISFKKFNKASDPVKRMINNRTVYEWNSVSIREPENYSYLPSWYNSYNYIQVSEYQNWQEVARWAEKVNSNYTPGPLLLQKISTLKQAAKGDTAKYLLQALRFVQDDIRYMGIEMGEYSHKPNSPDKVLTQRFGDCKDKALLLCTMLRHYGINARIAYVNTEAKGKVKEMLPGPGAFNHVIVQVNFRNKVYWLDGTVSLQRGSLDDLCEPDFQVALVASDTTTRLTPIVITNRGSVNIKETFTLPDQQYKEGHLAVVTDFNKQNADDQRAELAGVSVESKDESFLNYYQKLYGDVKIKDSLTIQDTVGQKNTLRITESYTINNPWKRDSTTGKLLFTVTAQSFYDILSNISRADRQVPVTLRFPYTLNYKIVVNTPIDWTIDESPVHIQTDYYVFDYTIEKNKQQFTLNYHYETLSDHIPLAFIPTYFGDLKRMKELSSMDLSWNPLLSGSTGNSGKPNWLAIVLALFFLGAFTCGAMLYYQRSVMPAHQPAEPVQIGGGLALLAIGLVFSPLMEISQFFKLPAFSYDRWVNIQALNTGINITLLQLFLILEMMVHAFLLAGSILLAVLFFNRRDTFPFTLATYYFITAIFIFVDNKLAAYLFKPTEVNALSTYYILIPLVKMAIWIPYIRLSERGRSTFVIPYRRPDNNG